MLEIDLPKIQSHQKVRKKPAFSFDLSGIQSIATRKLSGNFSNKKKQIFYNDLSVLLSSGINLVSALDLVSNGFKKEKDKKQIRSFITELTEGKSFSEILKDTNRFSPYEYYSIKIGEETGKLKEILTELSNYINGRIQQKRKVVSAFSYPFIILLTAIIAIAFMLNFIVPMFEEIFKRFDKELPMLTKIVIKISQNFSTYSLIILMIVAIIFLINFLFRNNDRYQFITSSIMLNIPIFGVLINKVILARFCLTMELLLSAKTPLVESIRLSKNMISMFVFKDALSKIEQNIYEGVSLHDSMQQFKIFDIRMLALIKVAEEVNKMEEIFKQLKEQFNNDIEYQTGIISSIMEPMLIVFIGLFVGMILVSMYLPIFKISTSFM
ncbi:MAG: type II secretion system F family protein [Bacteroidota bacterium]